MAHVATRETTTSHQSLLPSVKPGGQRTLSSLLQVRTVSRSVKQSVPVKNGAAAKPTPLWVCCLTHTQLLCPAGILVAFIFL